MSSVLDFWGFSSLPFVDRELEGNEIELFANRTREIENLILQEGMGVVGVLGSQGMGKSSLAHRMLHELRQPDRECLYLKLKPVRGGLMRQVLEAVLEAAKKGRVTVKNRRKLKIGQRLKRLQATIAIRESVGAKIAIPKWFEALIGVLQLNGSKEHEEILEMIREAESSGHLKEIFASLTKRLILYLDNSEKLAKPDDYDAYVEEIAMFAEELRASFSPKVVTVMLSLDARWSNYLRQQRTNAYDHPGYAFGQTLRIDRLDRSGVKELIERRLKAVHYQKPLDAFISDDALGSLMRLTRGVPRTVVLTLGTAIPLAYQAQAAQITGEILYEAVETLVANGVIDAREKSLHVDQSSKEILEFLRHNGPTSPSDTGLQTAVGLKRSALSERLSELKTLELVEAKYDGPRLLYQARDGASPASID